MSHFTQSQKYYLGSLNKGNHIGHPRHRIQRTFHTESLGVSQFVRHDLDAQSSSGILYSLLHGVFHHAPAHDFTCPRMPSRLVHRKKPCPLPGKLIFWILASELVWQLHRNAFALVTFPDRAGMGHLPLDFRDHRFRQPHHAVLAALCAQDAGNGSKAICRVIYASRSPSPDPHRYAQTTQK